MKVEEIARVVHEANRALQLIHGDPVVSPEWEDAPEWQRASSIEGVSFALEGTTPEELHQVWCQRKLAEGWVYGEVKDADAKTHPCLVPYAQLPVHQRAKDELFAAIVKVLG